MEDIHKRLDDWWLRGSFPTFEWSRYFYIASIEGEIMWLIEVESDEDGFYPREIFTAFKLEKEWKAGDLIHYSFFEHSPSISIQKGAFEKGAFMDWFEEKISEKNQKLNPVYFKRRK